MRRRDTHTLALALIACGSLAAHAAVIWSALEFGGRDAVAAWAVPAGGAVERNNPQQPTMVPLPAPLEDDPLGAADGRGTAVADAAGAEPLRAMRGKQDQPLLGSAAPGPLRDGPDAPTSPPAAELLRGSDAPPPLPASPPPLQEMADAAPLTPPSGSSPIPTSRRRTPNAARTLRRRPTQSPTAEPNKASPPPTPSQAGRAADTGATDPGPDVDNEVDLFAKDVSAEFRAGEVVAQKGRKFKISGLRQGLASFLDLAYMPRPVVIRLRLELDAAGTPLSVAVERSSGSRALDEAVRKALYRSTFEPDPRDAGKSVGEPFLFTMTFE